MPGRDLQPRPHQSYGPIATLLLKTILRLFKSAIVSGERFLPKEVRETVDLYLEGKIDQWFSLQGPGGVAFILNVTNPDAAHAMLEKLPLGRAHLMSFEPIPLAPLNPLRQL